MFVLKIPKKVANDVLTFVKKNDLFDDSYETLSEDDSLFVAIKDKSDIDNKFPSVSFVDKDLKAREKQETDLREYLSDKLTGDELNLLKTAFDNIGTIAILEVPEDLESKEKLIADSLMKINSRIKTVLKKSGIHEGEFRTQKLQFLAGENTKETVHKENGVSIKLNVEDVYFSVRSSNERARVASLVKPGESVLVMFSGCAPFVCTISKNSKAGVVFGVELNPIAHKYALENIKLNKSVNTSVINGDVREVIPNFYKYIIGLKTNDHPADIKTRLEDHPRVIEFHLNIEDLFEKKDRLEKAIDSLQNEDIDIILHMPFENKGGELISLEKEDPSEDLEVLFALGDVCVKYGVPAVVHPLSYIRPTLDEDLLVKNLSKLRKFFDYFYFENGAQPDTLFCSADSIFSVARKADLKKLCIDVCHTYLYYKDNDKVINHIKKLNEFDLYFHLSDSDGVSHGAEVGSGKVDFDKVLPLVKKGVMEVKSGDELHPGEMLRSYEKIIAKKRTFDRIVMPLPKSAETFLDTAFEGSKKGTIIHLYLFLTEEEIKTTGYKKVLIAAKEANKKVKILGYTLCGHYSPGTYRVCIDFEVLN